MSVNGLDIVWETCPFKSLSVEKLYEIIQLRQEIFVVEQDCPYIDADGIDLKCIHISGYHKNKLIAYSRIMPPGINYKEASIGRIITKKEHRGHGVGYQLVSISIEEIYKNYGNQPIRLSGQTYARAFYEKLGFISEGKEYLEDGIPHISLVKPPLL